ncbi:signal peptidase I [Jeotgalibacillus sp. JSM ZJ347]|uniref:signal peptidase I n=1 Tax=Jeotgalibacillus sp. JSM ZJ347 TaxID=3342117 RepID=UPI0035A91079
MQNKYVNKVLKFLKWGAFILIILIAYTIISARITGADPSFMGYQFKNVLSGSMEPTFRTGSVIQIKLTEKEGTEYEPGDIITFQRDGILITHRIIEKIIHGDAVTYRTKGDNNDGPDIDAIPAGAVLGQYTGITIPWIGYPLGFASSKLGALILFLIPGVIFLVFGVHYLRGWRLSRG